ncbi:hypothetical protein [Erythrobacter crassostreae]|uniref:Uncharacterized protein n=1 Tax=Erythrobacter crassostreae TaxID=2828328 RepID=A0A9X1F288_9SPHN|nr:hypothetical protein [Erythrobacter crassostrea]MBV7258003.1 hypothetical protein [Erythrobacter crassostrea]
MLLEDVALIAFLAIIIVTVIDWRRGKTAIGKLQLTKKGDPEKYWMALVIYFNMAFGLFWLAGQAAQREPASDQEAGSQTVVLEVVEI